MERPDITQGTTTEQLVRELADLRCRIGELEALDAERRQTERVLRQSEQRFRDIALACGDWIWEMDAEGRYTYASPVVERVLGYPPEEIVGRRYDDLFPPQERDELWTLSQEAFRGEKRFPNSSPGPSIKTGTSLLWKVPACR